jgi:hypothetical protein
MKFPSWANGVRLVVRHVGDWLIVSGRPRRFGVAELMAVLAWTLSGRRAHAVARSLNLDNDGDPA